MVWHGNERGDLREVPAAVDRSERCQTACLQKHEPFQVVACSLEVQGKGDADDTHAAHQLAAHVCQRAEDMFDTGARCGDAAVTLFLRIGDARGGASFALDVHAPAFLFQLRLPFGCGVAAIGIDIAAGVGAVQQRLEHRRVGHGGMRDGYFAHQLVALVHAGVQLVAEVALAVLLCPTRIDILLRALVRLPAQRHRAFLDAVGFLALVALDRCLHQRGVDDLAATRHVAVLL